MLNNEDKRTIHEITAKLVRVFSSEFLVMWWIAFLVCGSTHRVFSKRQRDIEE